jgi:hypothetical protein
VSIRAPCCKQWFDCAECHAEVESHPLAKTTEMAFMCKKCKKAFRKDMTAYEESDEYCPHCDNHYVRIYFLSFCSHLILQQVIEAKTPHAVVGVEGEDARVDARCVCWTIVALFLYNLLTFSRSVCSKTNESSKSTSDPSSKL